jgi:hypothetical protein
MSRAWLITFELKLDVGELPNIKNKVPRNI